MPENGKTITFDYLIVHKVENGFIYTPVKDSDLPLSPGAVQMKPFVSGTDIQEIGKIVTRLFDPATKISLTGLK